MYCKSPATPMVWPSTGVWLHSLIKAIDPSRDEMLTCDMDVRYRVWHRSVGAGHGRDSSSDESNMEVQNGGHFSWQWSFPPYQDRRQLMPLHSIIDMLSKRTREKINITSKWNFKQRMGLSNVTWVHKSGLRGKHCQQSAWSLCPQADILHLLWFSRHAAVELQIKYINKYLCTH